MKSNNQHSDNSADLGEVLIACIIVCFMAFIICLIGASTTDEVLDNRSIPIDKVTTVDNSFFRVNEFKQLNESSRVYYYFKGTYHTNESKFDTVLEVTRLQYVNFSKGDSIPVSKHPHGFIEFK